MKIQNLESLLISIAHKYPKSLIKDQLNDVKRIAFHINLVLAFSDNPTQLTLCDIGGGIGLFSIGIAALGFKRVILIDDFKDEVNKKTGNSIFSLHRKYGVEIISRDAVSKGIKGIRTNFDFITTFDSMEHWHNSPKKLLKQITSKLKPSGHFICGVPNCMNIKKRITAVFGVGHWSSMQDWYESEVFRGHVREPNVTDLKYISKDMDLDNVLILGRNWLGYNSPSFVTRKLASIFDFPLRLRPSLCSNLYLIGSRK